MGRINQQVVVEVRDQGKEGDKRRITIDLNAHSELFILSDLLVREGALKDLESVIKNSLRKSIAEYIQSGKDLVRNFANQKREISKNNVC